MLTTGLEASRDVDGGALDPNDALVVMARDAGPRAPSAPPGAITALEIRLRDPLTSEEGWLYLATTGETAPRSSHRYVRLDADTDSIEATYYGLTFSRAIPISWAYFGFKGPDGRAGPNIMDRIKLRIDSTLLFDLIEVQLGEEDLRSVVVGYLEGPVRVLRRVSSHIQFGLGIESPELVLDSIYYRDAVLFPSEIELPFRLGLVVSRIRARSYFDLRSLDGWKLYSGPTAEPAVVDGTMTEAERALGRDPVRSYVFAGDGMGLLSRVIVSPELESVQTRIHFLDEPGVPDPPESDPGQKPSIGYLITGHESVPAGTFPFVVELRSMRDYVRGDEVRLLETLERPLEVSVSPRE